MVKYCVYIQSTCPMSALPAHIEDIHPGLWRASQLGRASGRTVNTGYANLSVELPGRGWPCGAMTELLLPQPGVGEMRLLAPALAASGSRQIAVLQPPHLLNVQALAFIGLKPEKVLLVNAPTTSDALWCAEQILKAGSCAALLFWQQHVRADSLRRMQLAAKTSEALFFMLRPIASAVDASPAELRLAIRPSDTGVSIDVVKRKGPALGNTIAIELRYPPSLLSKHPRARRTQQQADVVAAFDKATV
jgi:protein ImuA